MNQARKWNQAQVQVQEQVWIVLGAQKYRGRLVDGRLASLGTGGAAMARLGLACLT